MRSDGAFLLSRRDQIIALAARHAIAAIYGFREYSADGGLISFGNDIPDAFRAFGSSAARRPADRIMMLVAALHESAFFGPKQTSLVAPHMSAFGSKADITLTLKMSAKANIATTLLIALYYHGAKTKICLGLSIVVYRRGRHAATWYKRSEAAARD